MSSRQVVRKEGSDPDRPGVRKRREREEWEGVTQRERGEMSDHAWTHAQMFLFLTCTIRHTGRNKPVGKEKGLCSYL